jgi:Cdc6-like AAA superfamily ATPase
LPAPTKTRSFVKPVVPLNRPTITFVAGANGSGKTSFDPLEL